jgi:hypothetical protein
MRRVAVEQQSWIMKGMWFLSTVLFLAVVAGFPWQTQAQTPCPRASQCVPDGVVTTLLSPDSTSSWSILLAKERAMQEQTCPTCYGEGMENHLSRSRVQTLRDSPRFYSVYCKVCGTPSAPSVVLISIAHR